MEIDPKIIEDLKVDIKRYKKIDYMCLDTLDILKSKVNSLEKMLFKVINNINHDK